MIKKIRNLPILFAEIRGVVNIIGALLMFYCVFSRKMLPFSP